MTVIENRVVITNVFFCLIHRSPSRLSATYLPSFRICLWVFCAGHNRSICSWWYQMWRQRHRRSTTEMNIFRLVRRNMSETRISEVNQTWFVCWTELIALNFLFALTKIIITTEHQKVSLKSNSTLRLHWLYTTQKSFSFSFSFSTQMHT